MEYPHTSNIFTILVVDDELFVHHSLKRTFAKKNYNFLTAMKGVEALQKLVENSVDLVILDLKMPGMDGMTVLKEIKQLCPDLKVIILTGHGGVSEAVEALKYGASDFIEKGGAPEILRTRIKDIYESWLLKVQNTKLKEDLSTQFSFPAMIGESTPIKRLKDMIFRVAPTDTTVLIQGESGTGKELVARAIHHHSNSSGPFVPVDCASISENVIESELFGHSKGAFTGADSATVGLIRSADNGTLFLDEIGELSVTVQAKFLRAIQERIVRPVGSTKSFPVNIRIVAATNRDLLSEVAGKTFRQDLYYRLSTVTLTSPPLRDREGDIELLTEQILNNYINDSQNSITILEEALKLIKRYTWPGNIRELENVLRSAAVFANKGLITAEDLPPELAENCISSPDDNTTIPPGTLASYELRAIKEALRATQNNRRKASEILDIAEATLYRKIKQYNL